MAQVPSYGSVVVNGQLIPVFTSRAFTPPPAVGPILNGAGQAPLATLPSGINGQMGISGNGGASVSSVMSAPGGSLRLGLLLAGMFVLGILGLRYVHWRA